MTGNRHGWWIGILVFGIMVYILLNTLSTEGPGSQGPRAGKILPDFAMPLVESSLDGDANLATEDNLGDAGPVPACEVDGPVLNVCDLREGAPIVLGFFFTRGSECTGSFDAMQRLQARTPGVRFAGVIVRGDRDEAREIVREHGWTFPIGFDRDGAVANVYGIAGCPLAVLAYPGGEVKATVAGRDRAERELERHVDVLVAASRERGWRPAP